MERAVVYVTLFGLLLALVTTLPIKEDWDIYSFHINSTVTSRYATTVITSRVANRMDESKEIEFHVRIPKNAFISKFRMFIDGQLYDGAVKAKEQAQQEYTDAVSRGQSAGIVSSVGRTLEEFKTSVTVAPHKKVTFELTYEELLKRRNSKYELQIHARPMQPVKDFKVDVYIHEKAGISFINVQGGLSTKDLANAITKTHADKQAWVYFYPTEDQQETCDSCGEQGMNGDLVVVYDVNRKASIGDIKKSSDGYFVHHFAPSNLTRISKNVVFIIDQSGSMSGRKIQQTRIALLHILSDLAEDDYFGLITFDSEIFHWKRELVQASKENLDGAKEFVQRINDRGATDINLAVLEGARMLNAHRREGSASILILLTDGDPTSGVTNLGRIKSNVKEAIAGKFPLYCLGFGYDVNFEFLKTMSLQNDGVARRIYDDSDADLQLRGFYVEVATPLLTDVTMIYLGGTNLTQTNFSQYYDGSEIVVAGQITDNNVETFIPQVVALSRNSKVTFLETNITEIVSDDLIQRVWAYLTVKQLLEKELQLSGPEKDKVKEEALELSLKYSFVTPLTSMVVTKPPGESTDVLHKPQEGGTHTNPQRGSGLGLAGGSLGIYRGATDINLAVLEGARMLNAHRREGSASILILLTDGDPTSGVTNLGRIKSNVKEAIAGKFPLYCLGFGYDVNFEFLKTMSLQNDGVARRIYDDSDADLQLRGFYVEVATPLLTDVTMIYLGGTNLTQTNFSQYYDGSEIVVAGQITDNNVETFIPQVVALSRNSKVTFSETNITEIVSDDLIQRVWAYLTVKQLLEKELQLSGPEKDKVKEEALELSLKYSFVTPLTSMVVTKPPGESTDVLHKPKEGGTHTNPQRGSGRGFAGGSFGSSAGGGYGRGRPSPLFCDPLHVSHDMV
ncbi:inter-alpha-trypsin inhibitor heavy chain H3-like [Hippoglossus hippoglossus]|uniref:inter-alpha-trypsin inhibitor heavy chain H3-like n=1 Tax=Hippoglossus hippoglossus TaxID=8267 RepID=UPI00148E5CE7|nr:inter-alpha-trypsin inhibitor heavy chain H3-like [Hippoglossus hippoglossus]